MTQVKLCALCNEPIKASQEVYNVDLRRYECQDCRNTLKRQIAM